MRVTIEDAEIAFWMARYVSENSPADGGDEAFSLDEQYATALLAGKLWNAVYASASDLAAAGILSAEALLALAKKVEAAERLASTALHRTSLAGK